MKTLNLTFNSRRLPQAIRECKCPAKRYVPAGKQRKGGPGGGSRPGGPARKPSRGDEGEGVAGGLRRSRRVHAHRTPNPGRCLTCCSSILCKVASFEHGLQVLSYPLASPLPPFLSLGSGTPPPPSRTDTDELLRELNSGGAGWLRDEEEADWGLDDVAGRWQE